MPFWRKNESPRTDWKNVRCEPVDFTLWLQTMGERAPQDGRYHVGQLLSWGGSSACLISERSATRSEVQTLLKNLERDYGKRLSRQNEIRVDDLDGVWTASRRGQPTVVLNVSHPERIRLMANYVPPQEMFEQMGMAGRAQAVANPEVFFTQNWVIEVPKQRRGTATEKYGQHLDVALRRGSPLDDLDVAGLNALLSASQAVANNAPADHRLQPLDQAALNYLHYRMKFAKAEGMHTAAFFGVTDRRQRQKIESAKNSAEEAQDVALRTLQDRLRYLFKQDRGLFDTLNLEESTLIWLNLDDIVDNL